MGRPIFIRSINQTNLQPENPGSHCNNSSSKNTTMQKRLFCTQAAIQIENTIKNTSLSKKWIIKQVKKSNFSQVLDEIKPHISNSDFIAISLQKTGSYSSPWQRVLPFDTPEISYLKAKRSAERFQVLQFAVCPFTLRASKLTAYPYVFPLFVFIFMFSLILIL